VKRGFRCLPSGVSRCCGHARRGKGWPQCFERRGARGKGEGVTPFGLVLIVRVLRLISKLADRPVPIIKINFARNNWGLLREGFRAGILCVCGLGCRSDEDFPRGAGYRSNRAESLIYSHLQLLDLVSITDNIFIKSVRLFRGRNRPCLKVSPCPVYSPNSAVLSFAVMCTSFCEGTSVLHFQHLYPQCDRTKSKSSSMGCSGNSVFCPRYESAFSVAISASRYCVSTQKKPRKRRRLHE
jgi:hypothetical protein